MSIITFFQQLFAQPITQKQIFAEDVSKINSLEKAIQQSELVVNYLLQARISYLGTWIWLCRYRAESTCQYS